MISNGEFQKFLDKLGCIRNDKKSYSKPIFGHVLFTRCDTALPV